VNYEGKKSEFELPTAVYRLDPHSGQATVVVDDFDRPNGLCFSPDERLLYVVDTGASHTPNGPRHIRVFDVVDGVRLGNSRIFVDMAPGMADGIRVDRDGNLWSSAGWGGAGYDGVHCFTPAGELIGKIHLPEPCSNLCFGGAKKNRLFMTAGQSLYAVYIEMVGVQTP
jgi:gluconolactonase